MNETMKKIHFICGLVAAFLCLSQLANAQYLPNQIHRAGANFVDGRGLVISDQELIGLVGEDVYFDTVVGARKQFNAGRKLITSGAISAGAGFAGFMAGMAVWAASDIGYNVNTHEYYDIDGTAVAGAALMVTGGLAAVAGCLLLDAGIPLKIIGKSRLNWVENDHNERAMRGYSFRVGAAPHGVGLTLNF